MSRERLALLMLACFPAGLVLRAGKRALGGYSFDQAGHLWAMWHATVEPLTTTTLLNHPEGLDLLPVLGGWADIVLGALLMQVLPLEVAYNVVIGLYLWLAGAGAYTLARVLGARPLAALVAGGMLQLEPLLLRHAGHGQIEQVGAGMMALAIAGAVASWRSPDWRIAVGTGLSGAAVVYISWESAVLLAGAMLVLSPGVFASGRSKTSLRQWWLAAGTTLAVAGPWAVLFLLRTSGVRTPDDGGFNVINAAAHALPIVDWFRFRPHMGPLLFAPLLLLPWTAPQRDRPLWVAAGLGLLLTSALAAGPDPSLLGRPHQPLSEPAAQWWAPFTILQQLPVLSWYHWPDRVMTFWPMAAGPAVALLLQRAAVRSPLMACAMGAAVLGLCLREAALAAPDGRYQLPDNPKLTQLAEVSGGEAVLDLPLEIIPQRLLRYQLFQIRHRRPLVQHSFPDHLHFSRPSIIDTDVARWSLGQGGPTPDRTTLLALREQGIGFISLHRPWLRGAHYEQFRTVIEDALGKPKWETQSWACWPLPSESAR